jgi:excisionase family DNA binding protein
MTQAIERLTYSIYEAVEATSIGRSNIYNLIRTGKLDAHKVGNRHLISAASLRKLVGV